MNRVRRIAQSLALSVCVGLLLFGSAGRLDLPAFWAYLGVWTLVALASVFLLDPTLFEERMRPGGRRVQAVYWLLMLPLIAHWVLAGLDVGRGHWTGTVPRPLQALGLLVFAAGLALVLWAMRVNRFFSSVVRIQEDRGHQLVSRGPYGWVRHPGYAAALLQALSSGIALGSWVSVLPIVPLLPALYVRIVSEDRFLRQNLPGYGEYATRVRYRLVPGLW